MNALIEGAVLDAVSRQKWYQRNANTIVSGLVALAAVLSFVATLGLDLPPVVAAAIPAAAAAIGTLATKLTKNGVQKSMIPKLDTAPANSLSSVLQAEANRMFQSTGRHRLE